MMGMDLRNPLRYVLRLVLAGVLLYYAASFIFIVSSYQNPWVGVVSASLTVTSLFLLLSIFIDLPSLFLEFLGLFTAFTWVMYIGTAFITAQPPETLTDEEEMLYIASHAFLRGEDPYVIKYVLSVPFKTPLLSGDYVSAYSYPALSFMIPAPFVALGLAIPTIVAIFFGISLLIAYLATRGVGRDIVLISYLATPTLYQYAFFGVIDALFYPFVIAAIILIDNPLLTGLMMGFAISMQQLTWPMAFFILIHYLFTPLSRNRARDALTYLGTAIAVFLATNTYFIIKDPGAYIHSVFLPATQGVVPLGIGYIAAFLFGSINNTYITSLLLTLVLVLALAVAQAYAEIKDPVRARYVPFIIGSLAFFFFWRSLANYFIMAVPFAGTALAQLLIKDLNRPRW